MHVKGSTIITLYIFIIVVFFAILFGNFKSQKVIAVEETEYPQVDILNFDETTLKEDENNYYATTISGEELELPKVNTIIEEIDTPGIAPYIIRDKDKYSTLYQIHVANLEKMPD